MILTNKVIISSNYASPSDQLGNLRQVLVMRHSCMKTMTLMSGCYGSHYHVTWGHPIKLNHQFTYKFSNSSFSALFCVYCEIVQLIGPANLDKMSGNI